MQVGYALNHTSTEGFRYLLPLKPEEPPNQLKFQLTHHPRSGSQGISRIGLPRSGASPLRGSGCSLLITMSRSGTVPVRIPGQSGSLDGQPVGRPLQRSFRILPVVPPVILFFYPQEEYRPHLMEPLEHMASHGIADVEVHLHHHGEGQQNFVDRISGFTETLFSRHGLLRKHNGIITFGFIHGL